MMEITLHKINNPHGFNKNNNILNNIQSLLDDSTMVIIGAIREDQEKNSYYNSMYLIDSNRIEYFDKKILVPNLISVSKIIVVKK